MKSISKIPFNPKNFPFYYGWVVMIAATIGILFSIPGQTMGLSVFTEYLIIVLGITRDDLSIAYLVGTILSSLLLTSAGRFWDRFGVRLIVAIGAVLLSFSLIFGSMSVEIAGWVRSILPSFIVDNSKSAIATFLVVTIFFFLMRFSGQGILTMVSRNVTMKWFDQNRGLANGISSIVVSLGFALSPMLLYSMIKYFGWVEAWQNIATALLYFVIFALIFYRDSPEDCGLIPDGKVLPPKRKASKTFENRRQYSLGEAKGTWAFWVYSYSLAFNSLFITGFTFNVFSIFEITGQTIDKALTIFIPAAIISVALSMIANYLSDYMKLQYLLFFNIIGGILATIGLIYLNSYFGYWMLISGIGIMNGNFYVLSAVTWPRFFGRKYLGAIAGSSTSIVLFASAFGPFLFSKSLSYTGGYAFAGKACLAAVILIAIFSFLAKNPQDK